MAGERHSFVQTEPVLRDEPKPNPIAGPQHRRTGVDPIDLRPIPTLRVLDKRLKRPVQINASDFDPERHDRIEGEPVHGQPEPRAPGAVTWRRSIRAVCVRARGARARG